MPLTEISNTAISQPRRKGGSKEFCDSKKIMKDEQPVVTEIDESISPAALSRQLVLDFVQKGASRTWICLLCNVEDIQDREFHIRSAHHQSREVMVHRMPANVLAFLAPQYINGCVKICPYRWTTCRLAQTKLSLHPGKFDTSSSIRIPISDRAEKPTTARNVGSSTAAPRDVRFACISPSEANYSWSCSLCNIHGLKAQAFWLHCLGTQHTEASQKVLEEQLAAELVSAATKQEAQGEFKLNSPVEEATKNEEENPVMHPTAQKGVEVDPQLATFFAEVEQVGACASVSPANTFKPKTCVMEQVDVKTHPELIESLAGAPVEQEGVEVPGDSLGAEQITQLVSKAEPELVTSLADDEPTVQAQERELVEVVAEEPAEQGVFQLSATPMGFLKQEESSVVEQATQENAKATPELIDPFSGEPAEQASVEVIAALMQATNNVLSVHEQLERVAAVTRNEESECWSCSLCGIYNLQAHSVKNHCLGKKHKAAFDKTRQQPQLPSSSKGELGLLKNQLLEVMVEHDKTIQEAARTDERYAFLNMVEENGSWSCSLCNVHELKVKDTDPHCIGKRHTAAFRAQEKRPLEDDIEVIREEST
jgi:hypothetical protein